MKIKVYGNPYSPDGSYTGDEIRRGLHWTTTDVECPHCGKLQPLAATGYMGGPCVRCGQLTGGATKGHTASGGGLSQC